MNSVSVMPPQITGSGWKMSALRLSTKSRAALRLIVISPPARAMSVAAVQQLVADVAVPLVHRLLEPQEAEVVEHAAVSIARRSV